MCPQSLGCGPKLGYKACCQGALCCVLFLNKNNLLKKHTHTPVHVIFWWWSSHSGTWLQIYAFEVWNLHLTKRPDQLGMCLVPLVTGFVEAGPGLLSLLHGMCYRCLSLSSIIPRWNCLLPERQTQNSKRFSCIGKLQCFYSWRVPVPVLRGTPLHPVKLVLP